MSSCAAVSNNSPHNIPVVCLYTREQFYSTHTASAFLNISGDKMLKSRFRFWNLRVQSRLGFWNVFSKLKQRLYWILKIENGVLQVLVSAVPRVLLRYESRFLSLVSVLHVFLSIISTCSAAIQNTIVKQIYIVRYHGQQYNRKKTYRVRNVIKKITKTD